MTTIDMLLKSVAPDPVAPEPGVVDSDLARGRAARVAARRRRTYRRAGAGALTLAVGGVAAVVVSTSSPSPATVANAHRSLTHVQITPGGKGGRAGSAHPSGSGTQIQLVDYTGAQLPGFTVKDIPQGWHLSTSTSTALLITPDDGSLNDDPYDFVGKLAVLPQSADEHGLGPGDPVTVNGRPGRVDSGGGGGVTILRYTTANGHSVDIQAPDALHWTSAQLVAFAQGVTVTANVGTTHG